MSSPLEPAPDVPPAPSWIDLRPPHAGWLDLTIELGGFRLEVSASWVINDPLAELVDVGLFLARRTSGTRRVCLLLEPSGYALDVSNVGEQLSHVRIGYASELIPPMVGRRLQTVHECVVGRSALAREIRRAVDALFTEAGPAIAPPSWRDPSAYAGDLARLREWVR